MGDPSVDPGDFARCVSKVLGVKVDVVSMTVRYEITGGFNRKWGLPLPQWTAFSGGSTFLIDCAEKPSAQRQLTLVATGVGERQAEGFGECRLESGLPFRRTIVSTPEELGERADLLGADSEVQSIAFRMLGRKLRVDLDRRLKRQAIRLAGEIRNRPSNSQFAGLRSAALQALHLDMAAGRQVIGVHAAGLSDVEMVRQSYARCRIDGIRFLTWLTDRIEDDATEVGTGIWGILGVSLPSLGGLQAQPSRELGFEYNMRLVHEVLRLAMKGEGVKT
jgi:CRISPR-associated protein Csx10